MDKLVKQFAEKQWIADKMKETKDPLLRHLEDTLGLKWAETIVCLGHIAPRIGRCYECKNDDKNKQCEHYKPVRKFMYVVKERGERK